MKRILSTFLLSSVILTGFPGVVLAEEINKPDMYKVSDTISYDVSAAISTTWPDHVNEDIVITNTGSNPISDWYLTFKVPCSIDDIWEASVYETDNNGTYSIKCADWNRTLQPGATVTVGLTLSSNEEGVN
ncbi:MAG: cellulose binding domain-containing protein, partial [Clostridiales bacterium]|nr:cellulose binding domain-containing protein [Clostridiales bacterium]